MSARREPALVPFVWFWSFWHWSSESFRVGASLRNPLQGIGGLWDEWFHHEASAVERAAIERVGGDVRSQRAFLSWLVRRWAREAQWRGLHPQPRFVLGQLAQFPPFDRWVALERYRTRYGVAGVFAVVLTEGSAGESADVRRVEALALPVDGATIAPAVVAEGFHAEGGELRASRDAAQSVLGGSGLTRLLTLWLVWGRRPYPRWLSWLLTVGWGVVGALIVLLLAAPDPGSRLEPMGLSLLTLWGTLVAIGVAVAGRVLYQGWRAGRALATGSGGLELRLRMSDGLRLMGGSAGLPLTLNALAAILRAQHRTATGAWIWTRLHRGIRAHGANWAATGIVGSDGTISAVALEPKLRACLQHDSVEHLLTPRQLEARRGIVARINESLPAHGHAESMRSAATPGDTRRLGFAAERRSLRSHACRHVADAVLTVAGLRDRRQLAIGALAMLASLVMLAALPDLRNILLPPPAPMIIATTGSSPFSLAITLDAPDADAFIVALESRFWANRREPLHRSGKTSRADVPLHRLAQRVMWELDDGTVWVERRRRFLFHEFAPGERVGAYSLRYMNQLNK